MAFSGFGEHAVDFYDGLHADNSKVYWTENVEIYRRDVREPMERLLADLEPEFGSFGSSKVFRPYRDLRFAADKTPYKTHCGAVFEQARGAGAFYVELSSDGVRVGGGCFRLARDQLARYRRAVDDEVHGTELEKIVDELASSGWQINGRQLATKPRGFAADHPRIALLRRTVLYATWTWPPDDTLHEGRTLDRVRDAWHQLWAFNTWAVDRVGASEEPHRR